MEYYMKIHSSLLDLIGNTPIVEILSFSDEVESNARLLAKTIFSADATSTVLYLGKSSKMVKTKRCPSSHS